MTPAPPPPERDPEFAPMPGVRLTVPFTEPGDYLRMLANPFLGLFGYLAWYAALCWVHPSEWPPWSFTPLLILKGAVLVSVAKVHWLFHYHCLDCGATGPLIRWRLHRCPGSEARRLSGRRRLRPPSPPAQMILWLIGLAYLWAWVAHFGWFP